MKRKSTPQVERRVALCYIRLSQTVNESDLKSPERQKANILAVCERFGWIPEWYEDAEKHKSGTKEANRPEWLRLKARINDPDVVALVVNDTSRAMRNTWRAIKLFEDLSSSDVKLYLAVSDRMVDIKNPDGRMSLYMQAFLDEMYALDASRRAKDSINYRKRHNISCGQPPFGTVRDEKGYHISSSDGAWKLPTGGWQAGKAGQATPVTGAIWRGYFEAARRTLELYTQDLGGYNRISKQLTLEGWAFQDRQKKPRLFKSDDVRRIVANWRSYAGIVEDGRAKERVAHEHQGQDQDIYDNGRAVFDLDLLRKVAKVQEARSITTRPTGSVDRVYNYGLLRLVYCAHCEEIAAQEDNPRRRSRLSGTYTDKPRYRHAEGVQCGCKKRSVLAKELEADFLRLVQLLTPKPEAYDVMLEMALNTQSDAADTEDLESQKQAAIASLKQQLANLLDLYKHAIISPEEYHRDREDRERQIVFWETRTTDRQRKALELQRVMAAFSQVVDLWEQADGDERLMLARGLFEYLVFDLDKQKIVDFRLHPWADQYLILRADLYGGDDENGDDAGDAGNDEGSDDDNDCGNGEVSDGKEGNKNRFTVSSNEAIVDPNGATGRDTIHLLPAGGVKVAKRLILFVSYYERDQKPTFTTKDRDQRIRQRYAEGEALSDLAREYRISPQRVFQIVNDKSA